ncbi:hypothetical protein [Bdellovibrio bacteriovorus]|uniref:Tyrosine specific protein phosphatases domain-containing protein n=1 Tax=Bdellovibrio bacteriovorus str. Tiberius TaxID=1069642 RepID=K7Z801_BDEBC|nr:hypothetical protein [Bdellovibrio bacteriovorus]AFY00489.1 Hypothetical protein Bdt_0783 [Bdellovibrio bacteriovorus str. Tiberius]
MKYITLSKSILFCFLTANVIGCAKGSVTEALSTGNSTSAVETVPEVTDPSVFRLDQEVKKYKARYELESASDKSTDNKGLGDTNLWGTRNFRVVLHGVLYRGGANNKYFDPPRSNTNPLPTTGLNNLCKEDFSAAVYLYSENFATAPKSVKCQNTSHQDQTLAYKQYAAAGENEKILAMVYDRIKGKSNGPIYAHCWNGWHSSGLISGMVLKQFCGWSNEKVDAYWMQNTDGNNQGFETIRKRLRDFKPLVKFSITAEERSLICPETY